MGLGGKAWSERRTARLIGAWSLIVSIPIAVIALAVWGGNDIMARLGPGARTFLLGILAGAGVAFFGLGLVLTTRFYRGLDPDYYTKDAVQVDEDLGPGEFKRTEIRFAVPEVVAGNPLEHQLTVVEHELASLRVQLAMGSLSQDAFVALARPLEARRDDLQRELNGGVDPTAGLTRIPDHNRYRPAQNR